MIVFNSNCICYKEYGDNRFWKLDQLYRYFYDDVDKRFYVSTTSGYVYHIVMNFDLHFRDISEYRQEKINSILKNE